jgi:hypothetical protein
MLAKQLTLLTGQAATQIRDCRHLQMGRPCLELCGRGAGQRSGFSNARLYGSNRWWIRQNERAYLHYGVSARNLVE